MNKKWNYIGILFFIAAMCFACGTVNHILTTHEGIVSSLCLMAGSLCGAIVCFKLAKK